MSPWPRRFRGQERDDESHPREKRTVSDCRLWGTYLSRTCLYKEAPSPKRDLLLSLQVRVVNYDGLKAVGVAIGRDRSNFPDSLRAGSLINLFLLWTRGTP